MGCGALKACTSKYREPVRPSAEDVRQPLSVSPEPVFSASDKPPVRAWQSPSNAQGEQKPNSPEKVNPLDSANLAKSQGTALVSFQSESSPETREHPLALAASAAQGRSCEEDEESCQDSASPESPPPEKEQPSSPPTPVAKPSVVSTFCATAPRHRAEGGSHPDKLRERANNSGNELGRPRVDRPAAWTHALRATGSTASWMTSLRGGPAPSGFGPRSASPSVRLPAGDGCNNVSGPQCHGGRSASPIVRLPVGDDGGSNGIPRVGRSASARAASPLVAPRPTTPISPRLRQASHIAPTKDDGEQSRSKLDRSHSSSRSCAGRSEEAPKRSASGGRQARRSRSGPGLPPVHKKASKRCGDGAKGKKAPRQDFDEHEKALLEEVLDESPGVAWDAIAGLAEVKRMFWEIVVAPIKNPALFSGVRSPPRGVLLFGPPGNGKTMLAKAVATECDATFFSISASSITSKWVGESEKQMRALFSLAVKLQPSVIFIDEIDSMLTSRASGEHESSRRLKTEFLVQLDGAATAAGGTVDRVLVLGATNRPGELDDAVLRRLPRRILIPLPEAQTRLALILKALAGAGYSLSDSDNLQLSEMTDGYSCSDLTALVREAAMGPIRALPADELVLATPESIRPIALADFEKALKKIRPSLSPESLASFEEWNQKFGGC